tara:strand:+ start:280 stop:804 length:525 start_codon:yes stop_codon:yes gene_type:complete
MKKVLLIFIFLNIFTKSLFAKDLSGNALECEGLSEKSSNYIAIQFLDENKSEFAFIKYINYLILNKKTEKLVKPKEPLFHVKSEVIDYLVTEDKIIMKTKNLKSIIDPFDKWRESAGEMDIYRDNLEMDTYIGGLKCKLVDYNNPNLFNKIFEGEISNPYINKFEKKSETKKLL